VSSSFSKSKEKKKFKIRWFMAEGTSSLVHFNHLILLDFIDI
jgi:hypothetical protein